MGKAAININQTIRDVYTTYCQNNGFKVGRKVEKLLIMDLYKAGYDVKELMIINKGSHKIRGPELKKRPIIEPLKEQPKDDIEENKSIKEENNGI